MAGPGRARLPPARRPHPLGDPPPRRDDPAHVELPSAARARWPRQRPPGRRGGPHRRPDLGRRRAHDDDQPAGHGRDRPADRGRAQDDRQRRDRHGLHLRVPHRGADRDGRDRPPSHDRPVARPGDDHRGHGQELGVDRGLRGDRGRGRRDRHPRARADRRGGRGVDRAPPQARQVVLDRRGGRGRGAGLRVGRATARARHRGDRQLRLRAPGRRRDGAWRASSGGSPGTRPG